MENILPNRETDTYGWLLIGLIGFMLLRCVWSLLGAIVTLFVGHLPVFLFPLTVLISIGIFISYTGILFRIKGSIVAIWILPVIGLITSLFPILWTSYTRGFNVFMIFGLIFSFIVPFIVTMGTRPFWPSFRPLSEAREAGFSRAWLRLPSDVESGYLEDQQDYSPPSPPSSQAQFTPDDESAWF